MAKTTYSQVCTPDVRREKQFDYSLRRRLPTVITTQALEEPVSITATRIGHLLFCSKESTSMGLFRRLFKPDQLIAEGEEFLETIERAREKFIGDCWIWGQDLMHACLLTLVEGNTPMDIKSVKHLITTRKGWSIDPSDELCFHGELISANLPPPESFHQAPGALARSERGRIPCRLARSAPRIPRRYAKRAGNRSRDVRGAVRA